jgi:hypothetical protein
MTDPLTKIVDEAKATYELKDRLKGRNLRTGKHTLFTDDVTGKEHLEVLRQIATKTDEITAEKAKVVAEVKSGDIVLIPEVKLDSKAVAALEKEIAALEAQLPALQEKIEATAFSFEWRAIPEIIVDAAKRKTLQNYGDVNGEVNPIDKDDADHYYFALLFKDACTKVFDHEAGTTGAGLDFENAAAIFEYGGEVEYKRLNAAFAETQFQNVIIHQVIDTPDF